LSEIEAPGPVKGTKVAEEDKVVGVGDTGIQRSLVHPQPPIALPATKQINRTRWIDFVKRPAPRLIAHRDPAVQSDCIRKPIAHVGRDEVIEHHVDVLDRSIVV
jgi:hypothetical protein